MTLQLCASRCALVGAMTADHLTFASAGPPANDALPSPDEPPEIPAEDDDWDESSPTLPDDVFLDFCEIDDAPEPQLGDYWDDSLDGEWDGPPARQRRMTKSE